jgi:molybdopterin-binding protein
MSNIIATIDDIKNCENLHIVRFKYHSQILSMMSLELSDDIKIGTKVRLGVKSSHISIGKNFSGNISFVNILPTKIIEIENGTLLSAITLKLFDTTLEAIIPLPSVKQMDLNVNDEVTAFIQMSELSISEIIYD